MAGLACPCPVLMAHGEPFTVTAFGFTSHALTSVNPIAIYLLMLGHCLLFHLRIVTKATIAQFLYDLIS